MSYALGTRGYIPNLKDWDKDLYKDRGPGGEIRYKVNEKDQQYLSERQISEMKSDFLNKGQAEHTDKQYWSDIRFNESVRGTLGNIRDIPKNLVAPFKQPGITGNDRTARPNMDIPEWMVSDENYSKYINKKSGHFHSLLHQKQALNQYDVQRDAAAAQAKIDQGVVDRDKLLEANRIENAAVIAELNKPVSTGNANVDSTEKVKEVAESQATSSADLERDKALGYDTSLAGNEAVYDSTTGTMKIPGQDELIKSANERLDQEQRTPNDPNKGQTKQPNPNAAQQNFDKIAGAIHGLATIAKALDTGEFTPPRTPSSWDNKAAGTKTAEASKVDPTPEVSVGDLASTWDPDKNRLIGWRA